MREQIAIIGSSILLCVGLVGNGIGIITLTRMRHSDGIYFLIALTVTDFVGYIVWVMYWLQREGFIEPNLMNSEDWACKTTTFLLYFCLNFSVNILVVVTAERFIVVWFPLRAKTICKKEHCLIVIGVVATLIFVLNFHNFFTRLVIDTGNGTTVCLTSNTATIDMPYGRFHVYIWPWIYAGVYFFFPVISLCFLNSLIIWKIRSTRNMEGKHANETGSASVSKQVTRTLIIVSLSFIIFTSPLAAMLIIEKKWNYQDDPYDFAVWSFLRTFSELFASIHHACNFFLYCLGGKRFRQEVMHLFCSCRKRPIVSPSTQEAKLSSQGIEQTCEID